MPPQPVRKGSDELPVIVQGDWSKEKFYFVSTFMAILNGGMKNLWKTRAYVDLFAGPGRCVDRDTEVEFDGSPLLALQCATPFTHLYFNDIDERRIDALKLRQESRFPDANVYYFNRDCGEAASQIRSELPMEALVLAFIDLGLYEISFDGLASLAQRPATDLIITFHTGPIKRAAHHQLDRVDKFLGDNEWRQRYFAAEGDPSRPKTMVLLDTLKARLSARLGYQFFGNAMPIPQRNPIYYLLFASRHNRGLDFWEKSCARSRSGQRILF